MNIFCSKCGKEISKIQRYCTKCGEMIKVPQEMLESIIKHQGELKSHYDQPFVIVEKGDCVELGEKVKEETIGASGSAEKAVKEVSKPVDTISFEQSEIPLDDTGKSINPYIERFDLYKNVADINSQINYIKVYKMPGTVKDALELTEYLCQSIDLGDRFTDRINNALISKMRQVYEFSTLAYPEKIDYEFIKKMVDEKENEIKEREREMKPKKRFLFGKRGRL